MLARLGEQPDDQAGVDSARQQAPDGHVGHQASLHRQAQRRENRVLPITFGPLGPLLAPGEVGFPIRRRGSAPVGLDRHQRRGWHLGHAAQNRARRRHDGVEGQIVVKGDGVDAGVDVAACQQRGQRRREPDPMRVLGQVQRFDTQPIAAEQHPAAVTLDDREREHAQQVIDEAIAPVVVGLEQNLGVAGREEPVAELAKFPPQLLVVVDAAVPADGKPQLRIDHRLSTRLGQVDDLQAAMAERDAALRPHAGAIRAPGCHRLGHGRDGSDIRCLAVETHLAGGSAHPFDPTGLALRRRGGR